MNKTIKITLIVAAALICAGLVLGAVAYGLGARLEQGIGITIGPGTVTSGAPSGIQWNEKAQADGAYRVTDTVRSLDLGWTAGQVEIVIGDGNKILLQERSDREITADYALRWGVKDKTLYVRYTEPGRVLENVPVKDLTVTIPRSLAEGMEELNMDGVSAAWNLSGITVEELKLDSASGGLQAENMTVQNADLNAVSGGIELSGSLAGEICAGTTSGRIRIETDTDVKKAGLSTTSGTVNLYGSFGEVKFSSTSGDFHAEGAADSVDADAISGTISLTGSYRDIDADTTSGKVFLELRDVAPEIDIGTTSADVLICSEIAPVELDIDTTSGSVELAIPGGSSFTLDYDTTSGELKSDLPLTMKGTELYSGDGSAEYSVSTTSGSLTIRPRTTEKD